MPRTLDQLLRFFLSQFSQSCVILLLSVGQKYLQNSTFVLRKCGWEYIYVYDKNIILPSFSGH